MKIKYLPTLQSLKKMKKILFSVALAWVFSTSYAQRNPVELVIGNQRTSADVTFAKPLDERGNIVLFNRTRYNVANDRSVKPTFGTSLGILYKISGGIYVGFIGSAYSQGSVLRTGFYGRYAKGDFSVRSVILTVELRKNPSLDSWVIAQYTPSIAKQLKLFSQVEIAGGLRINNGVQQSALRSRLGLSYKNYQFGLANDWEQRYSHVPDHMTQTTHFSNMGVFFKIDI
jgi:hypothetical protein